MSDFSLNFKGNFGEGENKFRNPFKDYASTLLPDNIKDSIDFAEYMWFANPTFSRGCSMVARYFITELQFALKDDKKVQEIKSLLEEKLGIIKLCGLLGDDVMCYANSFWSIVLPFVRTLQCPDTGTVFNMRVAFDNGLVEWKEFKFKKTAAGIAKCDGSRKDFTILDQPSTDVNKLLIKRWRPQEIDISVDEWSGEKEYYWLIPENFKKDIKDGKLTSLLNTPVEVIDAVKSGAKRFYFKPGKLYHASDDTVAGVANGGWGIPLVIRNFRHIYRSQLLDRYDEAINLDYITGIRSISPETAGSGGAADPIKSMGMDTFKGHVERMIKTHRQDPTTWHVSSVGLKYQLMGAEGASLTPVDLKRVADENILGGIGVPTEMYHMNLGIQAAPMALRLFEKTWPHIPEMYNNFVTWVADEIAAAFKHDKTRITMKKVTLADDISIPDIMLQLMSGQQVSPQTALSSLGIGDYREEVRKVYEAEKIRAEEERKFQEEMEQEDAYQEFKAQAEEQAMQAAQAQAGGGGMPLDPSQAGGAPAPAPGPGAPQVGGGIQVNESALRDPIAMQAEAQRIAQEIFPLPERRSIITDLTKTNNTLAAIVKEELRKIEDQAASMGIQQAKQQGGV